MLLCLGNGCSSFSDPVNIGHEPMNIMNKHVQMLTFKELCLQVSQYKCKQPIILAMYRVKFRHVVFCRLLSKEVFFRRVEGKIQIQSKLKQTQLSELTKTHNLQ